LDTRLSPSEPPVAAQFFCRKLYEEFAVYPTEGPYSMAQEPPAVVACAEHFYDHDYDITYALEKVFQDKANFYDTLGSKDRWPSGMLFGAAIDSPLGETDSMYVNRSLGYGDDTKITFDTLRQRLIDVGMEPFLPPGVDGWNLHEVWTLDRLSETHVHLAEAVPAVMARFTVDMFENKKTMSEALAPYELTGWTGRGKAYSYSVRVCGEGNFIEEENMPDAEKFSLRKALQSTDTAEERLAMWKATVLESMENLCQFMA